MFIQENAFENVICEVAGIFSRPKCVKSVREFLGSVLIASQCSLLNFQHVHGY